MDSGERPPSDEPDDAARDDERPDGVDEETPTDRISADKPTSTDREAADETVDAEPATTADDTSDTAAADDTSDTATADDTPDTAATDEPRRSDEADMSEVYEDRGLLYRFRYDQDGPLMWIREMLSSAAIVLVIGLVIFAFSGVWPPMVAVESASMEPNMNTGDLVFITEPGRYAPDAADNDIGVVTHEVGQETDYSKFSSYGSVIIFHPPDRRGSPIIHRAMFHVEEGEDWYERADERYHNADDCDDLRNCPAPHDGFVTLGDNNGQYDQVNGLAEPVKEEWVTGVARLRVPYLGYVRLLVTGQASVGDLLPAVLPVDAGLGDPGLVGSGFGDLTFGDSAFSDSAFGDSDFVSGSLVDPGVSGGASGVTGGTSHVTGGTSHVTG